jgi:hypothetical protein
MDIFPLSRLVSPGAEQIKPFKAHGRDHIAFRPPHVLLKRSREGLRQGEADDIFDLARRRAAGKGNNGAKVVTKRQPRRQDDGRAAFDHLWRSEPAQGIIAEQDRAWANRIANRHGLILAGRLPQPHAGPAAVGNELDPGGFQGAADRGECSRMRRSFSNFKIRKSHLRYVSARRKFLCRYSKPSSSHTALFGGYGHFTQG